MNLRLFISKPGDRPVAARPAFPVELAQRIQDIEARHRPRDLPAVVTGWKSDHAGVVLPRAMIHEFFQCDGVETAADAKQSEAKRPTPPPPLLLLTHLAFTALTAGETATGYVLWIGRQVWPHPRVLLRQSPHDAAPANRPIDHGADMRGRVLLERSIFVDPPDDAARLWAIDLALRCPAVSVVVAAGHRLTSAATRRLQLAAEAGSALALLARPEDELGQLSAAATRWSITPLPPLAPPTPQAASWDADHARDADHAHQSTLWVPSLSPRWRLTLQRSRVVLTVPESPADGALPARAEPHAQPSTPSGLTSFSPQVLSPLILEYRHDQGLIALSAALAHRPGSSASASSRRSA